MTDCIYILPAIV